MRFYLVRFFFPAFLNGTISVGILSGQPGFRDFSLIGDRFWLSSLIGKLGVLRYLFHSLLRISSRLMRLCGGGILAKTGSQDREVDFSVPEIVLIAWSSWTSIFDTRTVV